MFWVQSQNQRQLGRGSSVAKVTGRTLCCLPYRNLGRQLLAEVRDCFPAHGKFTKIDKKRLTCHLYHGWRSFPYFPIGLLAEVHSWCPLRGPPLSSLASGQPSWEQTSSVLGRKSRTLPELPSSVLARKSRTLLELPSSVLVQKSRKLELVLGRPLALVQQFASRLLAP